MEFLDTRNTSEEERNEIMRILAASNSVELPFGNINCIGSGGGGDDSILVSSSSSSSTIITTNISSSSSTNTNSSTINHHHHQNNNNNNNHQHHHHNNNNTIITSTNAAVNNDNNNNTNQDQVGIDVFTSITSPVPVVPSSATMLTVAASAGPSGTYQMAIHPTPHGTYLPPTAFRPQPGAFLPVPHHIYPACVFQLPIPHTYYPITHLASSATSPPASSMDNNPNIAGDIPPPDCEYYVTTTPQPHQTAMQLHSDRQDLHRDVIVTNQSSSTPSPPTRPQQSLPPQNLVQSALPQSEPKAHTSKLHHQTQVSQPTQSQSSSSSSPLSSSSSTTSSHHNNNSNNNNVNKAQHNKTLNESPHLRGEMLSSKASNSESHHAAKSSDETVPLSKASESSSVEPSLERRKIVASSKGSETYDVHSTPSATAKENYVENFKSDCNITPSSVSSSLHTVSSSSSSSSCITGTASKASNNTASVVISEHVKKDKTINLDKKELILNVDCVVNTTTAPTPTISSANNKSNSNSLTNDLKKSSKDSRHMKEMKKSNSSSLNSSSTATLNTSSDTSKRSWASLFKGNVPHDYSSLSGGLGLQSSNVSSSPSSFPNETIQEETIHHVIRSSNNNNSNANNISTNNNNNNTNNIIKYQETSSKIYQEDVLAIKLGRCLKDIHLKHSLPYLLPRGFINRGNWCYINATLQALLYCPPFYNLMREIGELPSILLREKSSTPIVDSFAKFFANFLPSEPMIKKAKSLNYNGDELPIGETFEPKCIYDVLGSIKSECLKGKQEDAEEFLSSVLNGLHDEIVSLFKYMDKTANGDTNSVTANGHTIDDEINDPRSNSEDNDSNLWNVVGPRHKILPTRSTKVNESPIMEIFGGSMISVRTAGTDKCGNKQPFFTLQLDIQSEKIKSVEDALKSLTSRESIHGYLCPRTKQTVEASYQTFLDQLPPILILHLKLFVYDKDGGSKKLNKKIDYKVDLELPRECLHMDRGGDRNRYSKSYKLLSVVYHDGTESVKGHYLTDIFHIGSSNWLRCDDNSVKTITMQQLLNPQPPRVPYLLFYRRCDTLRSSNNPNQPQRGSNNAH